MKLLRYAFVLKIRILVKILATTKYRNLSLAFELITPPVSTLTA